MKKYIIGFIMAVFAVIAILPLQVLAAGDEVRLKEDGGNVNVSVTVSEGAGEKVSSLQLGLRITDQDGNPVGQEILERIESLSFRWSQEVQARTSITEQRYQKETGTLRIYIAGTEPLFPGGGEEPDSLALGTVIMTENNGGAADGGLYISVVPDSFRKVQGTGTQTLAPAMPDAVPIVPADRKDPGGSEVPDPGQPENPGGSEDGSTGGPSGGTTGDTSVPGQPQVDKSQLQEVLNLAAGYQEADYTSESFGALKKAMKEGQAVLDDAYATQEEVDLAAEAVMNAIGGLVPFAATSVDERNAMYAGTSQAVGTGDMTSWQVCAAVAILSGAAIAGAVIRKKYRKGIF